MSNSESKSRKGKGGRKPKFDYTSEDFLSLVESYAKKGFTDIEYDFTDTYTEDNTRLGLVKESVYVDTRFEAKMRLYNYITRSDRAIVTK